VHFDVLGAAIAASGHQLVLHMLDVVGVRVLVAFGAIGDHAHARVLVTHVSLGDVFTGGAVVVELLRPQELVSASQDDVAVELGLVVGAGDLVAGDVGRLLNPRLGRAFGWLRVGERRNGILDRTQAPVVGAVPGGVRGQRQGNAERNGSKRRGRRTRASVSGNRTLACRIHERAAMRVVSMVTQFGSGAAIVSSNRRKQDGGVRG